MQAGKPILRAVSPLVFIVFVSMPCSARGGVYFDIYPEHPTPDDRIVLWIGGLDIRMACYEAVYYDTYREGSELVITISVGSSGYGGGCGAIVHGIGELIIDWDETLPAGFYTVRVEGEQGTFDFEVGEWFTRGDSNADGRLDISDAIFTLSFLFAGGSVPPCLDAADTNDSGTVDLADAVSLLSYLFAEGSRPAAPLGECGFDPSADEVSCEHYPTCEGTAWSPEPYWWVLTEIDIPIPVEGG